MKKPHEQEWRPDGRGAVEVWDIGADEKHGRIVAATGWVTEDAELERRLSAVPEMARALLLWLPENGHTQECGNTTTSDGPCSLECRTTRAALRKAGVL